jgi:cell division protein FtsL
LGVLAVVSVMVLLCALVENQIQVSQAAVERAQVDAQTAADSVEIETLKAQVASLESPAHIIEEARRIGMVVPGKIEFLRLPPRRQ